MKKTAKKKALSVPRGDWRTSWLDDVQRSLAKHASAIALIQRTLAEIEYPKTIQPNTFDALVSKRMAEDAKFRRAMYRAGLSEGSLFYGQDYAKTPRDAGYGFISAVKHRLSHYGEGPTKANLARAIKWLMDETGVTVRDIIRINGKADPHPDMWRDEDASSEASVQDR